jgi:ATP-dependent Lon protease
MTDNIEHLSIPVVPLRGGAVFPGITTTISVGRRRSLAAAQAALEGNGELLILVQYRTDVENPEDADLATVGVLATIRDLIRTPHVGVQMLVELHRRVAFEGLTHKEPYLRGTYLELEESSDTTNQELMIEAIAYLEQYADALGEANQHVVTNARSQTTNGALADYIAGILNLPFDTELELLTTLSGDIRLQIILDYLEQELRITEIRNKIQQDAKEGADKAQRDARDSEGTWPGRR